MGLPLRPLCSGLALATALLASGTAHAQAAFQGTGAVVYGGATINQLSGTTVQVSTPQTVINWTPTDNAFAPNAPILFQPAGTTATFTTVPGSTLTDFAVLNRILPADTSRPITLNGTIVSSLQGSAGASAGTVYFYSPSGLIIGANAVINVGSLGLTTADPWNGSGDWLSGSDRTVVFQPSLLNKTVTLLPGASITSSGSSSSYTAIVAPGIVHSGAIRTSGAAALVAADAATIRFSPDNLYTIEVSAAYSSGPGLTIDGGTIGRPATGPVAANQRLYLVAIPKNNAVTMLIQGGADLGFTPADQASIEGNAIVLSAGSPVTHGAIADPVVGPAGNVIIDQATFRDRVVASTTGALNLQAIGGDLTFAGGLAARADNVKMFINHGHTLSVGGDLLLDVSRQGDADQPGNGGIIDLSVGDADAAAGGGLLSVAGSLQLFADGVGGTGAAGTGGSIGLLVQGNGAVRVGQDLLAFADGQGGGAVGGASGGQGFGGSVSVRTAAPGARLDVGGAISLSASGEGGTGDTGGSGQGGSAQLNADGGQIRAAFAGAYADGVGGRGDGGAGGIGQGGTARVAIGGAGAIDLGPAGEGDSLTVSATGRGGDSAAGAGGDARGGAAILAALTGSRGTLSVAGGSTIDAGARGGSGVAGGGNATGGAASASAGGGALALGGIDLRAGGVGGDAGSGLGGNGRGGFALLQALGGGRIAVTGLAGLDASGAGGFGTNGGTGIGGGTFDPVTGQWLADGARIFAANGSVTIAGSASLAADGTGGGASAGGRGGDGSGGAAQALAENDDSGASLISLSGPGATLAASAQGHGGAGGDLAGAGAAGSGGTGRGGVATLAGAAGNGTLIAGRVLADVSATGGRGGANGGSGSGGAGGAASGGLAQIGAISGLPQATASNAGGAQLGSADLIADATGGAGGSGASGGRGGNAQDGRAVLLARGARVTIATAATLRADARGGSGGAGSSGATDGAGGDAIVGGDGGVAVIASNRFQNPTQRATLVAGSITAAATATGGASRAAAGQSLTRGGNLFQLTNADAMIGSVGFTVGANSSDGQAVRDLISVDGGTASIANGFTFTTAGPLALTANNGGLSAGTITLDARTFIGEAAPATPGTVAGGSWTVRTRGDFIVTALLRSGSDLKVDAPGRIATYGVDAVGALALTAGNALTAANTVAGDTLLRASGPLTVGNVSASGRVLLASGGALSTGNVSGGGAVALLAHGNITAGSVSAPTGTVLIGDDAMAAAGGALANYNWAALLAATPIASGGTLAISGAVQAQRLTGAVGGNASFAGAVTGSDLLRLTSGGLIDIAGLWTAPTIDLTSADLALGTNAGLSATDALTLRSSNATQLLIGDALAGSGYALSNAEFGRLRGGSITLTGRADASAARAILIGQLGIAASQLGPSGTLRIATATPNGRAGVIGITGAVTGSGFGAGQSLDLEASRIELDTASGSVALTGANGAPGGTLNLRADRVWAAESAVLARLGADPAYAGRAADLARPTTLARPDGVIRAASIQLFGPQQVLVQNTGTSALPAGVVATSADLIGTSAGPIELIVNGQIAGSGGTATTGFDVWSAITRDPSFRLADYSAGSSVNGCLLSAASCTPVATRDADFRFGVLLVLPDRLFGDGDGGGKKGKRSPISAAEQLVDGKPVDRLQPVDEPVSGSGNPALMGQSAPVGGTK